MRKITDYIVNKRNFILGLFIFLTALCIFLMNNVNINYDISEYLPNDSETRIGMNIMEDEFQSEDSSSFNLMFKGLTSKEKEEIHKELENIENVSSVEYDNTSNYNKDEYTLYIINVSADTDSNISSQVYKDITKKYQDYKISTSGDISSRNESVLKTWIVGLALVCALIILIIMCDSYVHPFLILFTVGLAVFLNKGTNIIFSSVSNITNSIVAILQIALSMDYAIMLINRYAQEREKNKDKEMAMKEALSKEFGSIASSSITTIVGLLALVFMSFTIGKDLGFVLAKGVLLSLISILFCLPSLLLMFDTLIEKTKKKVLQPKLSKLGKFEYLIRKISIPLLLLIFIGSYFLKGNLGILYTSNEKNEVVKAFPLNNQMAVIYKNEDEEKIAKYCKELEKNDNTDQVLCYGNTINEKLKYNELLGKLDILGTNVDIDEYLIKIIYYSYYNSDGNEKMSFEEFITFINEQVYSNEKLASHIDDNKKNNINKLKYFSYSNEYNKERTSYEIADILGIDKDKVDSLFIYYNSKNINTKLTISEFINFINKDVLTDSKYSSQISKSSKNDLKTLSKFTDKSTINKKLTSKEMADIFGIDNSLVSNLYIYYTMNSNVDTTMTINEFVNFVLNEVAPNKTYSNYLSKDTIDNLEMIKVFTDKSFINKKLNSKELSNTFELDEESVKGILFLYYYNKENNNKYSLKTILNSIVNLYENKDSLNGIDVSSITELKSFIQNKKDFNTKKLSKENLSYIFNDFSEGLVDEVYLRLNLPNDYCMSIQDFINLVIDNMSKYIDNSSLSILKIIKFIIEDSINPKEYSTKELADIFGKDETVFNILYNLIDYSTNNISNWKLSSVEFVNVLLDNKDNQLISDKLDSDTINKLTLLKNIMSATNTNTKFTYTDLVHLLGVESNTTKRVYSLYKSTKQSVRLTPMEFVDFILNHKNDTLLSNNINKDMLTKLQLINEAMNSTIKNKKYSTKEMSKLLGIEQDKLNLLYSLYLSKYTNNNKSTLKKFVNFIVTDVMKSKEYSNNFTEDNKIKLNTVNGIIKASDNNTKYTTDEIVAIMSNLTDSIDKDTIELLYIYYGSEKLYNNDWYLTVENFINYINSDLLTDDRFESFIDSDMREKISTGKDKLDDAKKMLVGERYSRIVINSKLEPEGEKTFKFIQSQKDELNDTINDFYFIGNSPMALDISNSFNSELDFITILTMIAIFVAVAFTFKSATIPAILVIIIQCAVYLTMGILSMAGGTVYFIALLIVQSILMGATIDYAIVYSTYYIESRNIMDIKESIIEAYDKSIHTILTSASILIIVTLIVGNFANAIAAKICKTLSQGTICSVILILVILPAILAACDKIIVRKNKKN